MDSVFQCEHIVRMQTLSKPWTARDASSFRAQFRETLDEAREPKGIVYVWRTENDIPRLRGSSPVVYIGKAKQSFYDRYIRHIEWEATNYWDRYDHIIRTFGPIWIDIYESEKPEVTENRFLFQYHSSFMERPPINIQGYKTTLPTT